MKKLYEVQMTVYVMAVDEAQAHFVAIDNSVEIPFEDCEIYEAHAVPPAWIDSIPYGSDDDKTCWEILKGY
jgi:hypothetical protein